MSVTHVHIESGVAVLHSAFVLVRGGQSGAIRAFQIISIGTGVISDKHKTVSGFYLVGRRL